MLLVRGWHGGAFVVFPFEGTSYVYLPEWQGHPSPCPGSMEIVSRILCIELVLLRLPIPPSAIIIKLEFIIFRSFIKLEFIFMKLDSTLHLGF